MAMTLAEQQAQAVKIQNRINNLEAALLSAVVEFSTDGTSTPNDRQSIGLQLETRAKSLVEALAEAESELCALADIDPSAYGYLNAGITRARGLAYRCLGAAIDARRDAAATPVAHSYSVARAHDGLGLLKAVKAECTIVVLQMSGIPNGFGGS